MTLQVLVSCVKQNIKTQAEVMNLESDAIIINQCDESDYCEYDHSGHRIRCYSFNERGGRGGDVGVFFEILQDAGG